MSQEQKKTSFAKHARSTSTETVQDHSLLQEIKEACLSELEHFVTLSLPHGSVLALLVEFAAKHGAEIIDLLAQSSDDEWDANEDMEDEEDLSDA